MHHCATHLRTRRLPFIALCCAALSLGLFVSGGCSRKVEKKKPVSRYPTMPEKQVAPILAESIFQRTDASNTDPYLVSGYGLVANLDNTGGSDVPMIVRDYMIKQMQQHRFGSPSQP